MKSLAKLLRPQQWVKNGFVLAPLFFGFELLNRDSLGHAAAAFVIFCAVSSAVYIFNDWRDIEVDRAHVQKRHRPLASGAVSLPAAALLFAILIAIAITVGLLSGLPKAFFVTLAVYIAINVGYSLGLKQVSLLELFLVASGFVLRLIAGGLAIQVQLSPWIMIATAMVALLLTVGKRRDDIAQEYDLANGRQSLAHYNLAYLDLVLAALTGGTLVVYLLFCASDYAVHRFGQAVLITSIPVAFGLLRYLQLVLVKGKGASPTDLVLQDPGLIAILAVFVLMFGILIYV
jgi:decaprenyl-phosphate phosphoribosyltransferase